MDPNPAIALMQAVPLPAAAGAGAPDWIHLLPAGPAITTLDGRGPYRVADARALIAASPDRLPIDENHAIDLAAPRGEASPARGYVVELQARDDGIWGRVDWTEAGRALVADRAYLGISPVIAHTAERVVTAVLRASLTNRPNLRGLATLHQTETGMTLMQRLAEALGLDAAATEDAIVGAVSELNTQRASATALQASLAEIGTALGVAGAASSAAVLAAARAAAGRPGEGAVVALQAELAELTRQLNAVQSAAARERAEAFVDGEIRRGRAGVKPLRDHYVARHMQDAAAVEKELGALPVLGGAAALPAAARPAGETVALQAEHLEVIRLMGTDPAKYLATLKAEEAL